jgi:hypothetical protein
MLDFVPERYRLRLLEELARISQGEPIAAARWLRLPPRTQGGGDPARGPDHSRGRCGRGDGLPPAHTIEEALEEIARYKGQLYDPKLLRPASGSSSADSA